ncbi:MAG: hypothetical protein ABI690_14840 [Chloroflexota bacterium]
MDEQLSRIEILNRLHMEYNLLRTTVDRLTSAKMLEPGLVDEWSVKDVLAQMIICNLFSVQEIRDAQFLERRIAYDFIDPNTINAQTIAVYRILSLERVMANLDSSFQQIVDFIEAMPDSVFKSQNTLECLLRDMISGRFSNSTYLHYMLRREQIETWAGQIGVTNG